MKVDKAVCTTDTMTDAESAISYENLLSTLVQKKILAIKRECEAKKVAKHQRKQKNCLGSLIFGNRRNDRTSACDDANEATATKADADQSINVQVIDSKDNIGKNDDDNQCNEIAVSVSLENQERGESMFPINRSGKGILVERETLTDKELAKCHIDVLNERCRGSGSICGDNDNNSTHDQTDFYTSNINVKNRARYKIETSGNNSIIELDADSTSTAATNSKSPSIVSQIEVSDEINVKQQKKLRTQKNSSDTISVPSSIKKHTVLSAPTANPMHDREQRHQKRLLEAKSISAQCSPVLTQRQTFNGTSFFAWLVFFISSPLFF